WPSRPRTVFISPTSAGCAPSSPPCARAKAATTSPDRSDESVLDAELAEHHAEGRVRDAGQARRRPALARGRHLGPEERLPVPSLRDVERQVRHLGNHVTGASCLDLQSGRRQLALEPPELGERLQSSVQPLL